MGFPTLTKCHDPAEWFTNPEHEHMVGIDKELADRLRSFFRCNEIGVDCGVEGARSFTYHFRISNMPAGKEGQASDMARDLLGQWTPYRFEVQCV